MTREEAIEELTEINFNSIHEKTILATNMAISALEQQKTGRWKQGKCSECGGYAPNYPSYIESKFCPNCGAKMEVEE